MAFWFVCSLPFFGGGVNNTVDGPCLWMCVCVIVNMFPVSVSVLKQRSDVCYCEGLNHFKCSL